MPLTTDERTFIDSVPDLDDTQAGEALKQYRSQKEAMGFGGRDLSRLQPNEKIKLKAITQIGGSDVDQLEKVSKLLNRPEAFGLGAQRDVLVDPEAGKLAKGLALASVPAQAGAEVVKGFLKSALDLGLDVVDITGKLAGAGVADKVLEEATGQPSTHLRDIIPKEDTEATNIPQKIGAGIEDVAEFAIPGSKVAKATKGAGLATRALAEGVTAAGVQTLEEGKLDKEVLATGVVGAAIPGAVGVVKKGLSPARLIGKALGFTKSKRVTLDKIAKEGGFEGVEDFALQKGFKGSREEIADQTAELFNATRASKKELVKNITETTPNKFDELLDVIRNEFDQPGQQGILKEIDALKKKGDLTAIELDRIRFLGDDILPRSAFTDTAPKKTEGIQKLIAPLRRRLEKIDLTGTIKQTNRDIQILHDFIPALAQSSKSSIGNQLIARTAARTIALAGPALAIPGVKPVAFALGLAEAATDIPGIASGLAQAITKLPKGSIPTFVEDLVKAGILKGTEETAEAL